MAIEEVQLVRKIELLIKNQLSPVRFIGTYQHAGDVFAEVYDVEDNVLEEFNVTALATEIVRALAEVRARRELNEH